MNYNNREERIAEIRKALDENRVRKVEFYSDGSGASFEYLHPTANHGLPCTISSSVNIEDALRIVSGFRFVQHELNHCM